MVIVDLQELEERAKIAAESIGGVVLEPEALLLIISELRRMKSLLGEQHSYLSGVRGELLQLRTEIADALTRRPKPQRKAKMLKMRVVKDDKGNGNTQN